jgi:Holliday junction resolvase RusA-like endonuclease
MSSIKFEVAGQPQPQGSKNGYLRGGRIVLVESSKNLKPYRLSVAHSAQLAAKRLGWSVIDDDRPIWVTIRFGMTRGKTVKRLHPTVKPDLDKLVRAVLDGITQSKAIWKDDAQVCQLITEKHYSDIPSTWIEVS